MIRVLKDSYKLSLFIAAVFFVSILISAYVLYALPHNLMLTEGYQSIFAKVYLTIAVSFLLGALALYVALKTQREIVVYKDRSIDAAAADHNAAANENKTTITLDGIKAGLEEAHTEKEYLQTVIQTVCKQLDAGQGALYLTQEDERKVYFKSGYALSISENTTISFDFGEGLIGQCAVSGVTLYVDDVPEGYIKIISGLGSASPRNLLIVPVKQNTKTLGVMEIASFTPLTEDQRKFAEEAALMLAEKISTK